MRAVIMLVVLGVAAPARAAPLSGDDLARKNAGGCVTAVPLAAYSVDFGYEVYVNFGHMF